MTLVQAEPRDEVVLREGRAVLRELRVLVCQMFRRGVECILLGFRDSFCSLKPTLQLKWVPFPPLFPF